ncbi:hypothetical protein BH10PSE7_BH10PSE7_09170 [soil metagenome]
MAMSFLCFRTAVLLGLIGFCLGIGMGMAQDFALVQAHAHLNLLGWVSFFLYGAFYHLVPRAALGPWPKFHYGLSLVGAVTMVTGIAGIMKGYAGFESVAIAGSLVALTGFLAFVVIVFRSGPVFLANE